MEQILEDIFGVDRRKSIEKDVCLPEPLGCGGPATEFDSDKARIEFTMSGFCQKCQYNIFGK